MLNLRPEQPFPAGADQDDLRAIQRLNQRFAQRFPHASELETRIRNYELAARMQVTAEKELDLSQETKATRRLYGLENPVTAAYGTQCLMARRLVEAGVRFVQIMNKPEDPWDHHSNLMTRLPKLCAQTDQPSAALIADLKQRGLLDQTLVLWIGEFGRLPIAQLHAGKDEKKSGRDHNQNAMVTWMAGPGLKRGYTHGSTDEIGLKAVEKTVSVPEWHATLLHLLGLDCSRLSVRQNGLDERLVGVNEPDVISDLLV